MSPELFDPETNNCQTKCSDCYALGMVVYEVLSERIPFYEYPDLVVYAVVFRGERPEKPEGIEGAWFTGDVWKLLERCWLPEPQNRPSIEDVLQHLEEASKSWTAPSPTRLLAIPSITGSSARGFLGKTTEGDMDASGVPPPSRSESSKKPEQDDSTGIASKVCLENPLCKFQH